MITYNHAAFIGQAIESVVAQKGDFDLELVIGEDCSKDTTRAVIEQYQARYPEIIKLITSPQNVGMQPNFIRTYEACTGEYVAMLEGDDYWVDEHKLQDQLTLLQSNPKLVMCFAGCAEVSTEGQLLKDNYVPEPFRRTLTQQDVVGGFCPPTLTALFRNRAIPSLPESFAHVANGDYFLFSMLTGYGDAAYLPRVVAHYRRHEGGVWTRLSEEKQHRSNLNTKMMMLDYFPADVRELLYPSILWYHVRLCTMLWEQNRVKDFLQMFREFARISLWHPNRELPALTYRIATGRIKRGSSNA